MGTLDKCYGFSKGETPEHMLEVRNLLDNSLIVLHVP